MLSGRDGGGRTLRGRTLGLIDRVESALLVLILAAMVGLAGAQIVLRNVSGGGIAWADPALRVLVLWIGMVGALAATRDDSHLTVDVVSRLLSERGRAVVRVLTDLVTAVVSGLIAWHAARLTLGDREAGLVAFANVPVWLCELILPIGFGLIAVRYLVHTVDHLRVAAGGDRG